MDAIELRNKALKNIYLADNKLLQMINALAESYRSEEKITDELTQAQKQELDARIDRIKRGETKFYTWEETQNKLNLDL